MSGFNTYLTQTLVIFLAGPFVAPASAGLPAFDFGGGGNTTDRDGMVGFQFAVDREVTITDLGKVDANANGRLDDSVPPTVGIIPSLSLR